MDLKKKVAYLLLLTIFAVSITSKLSIAQDSQNLLYMTDLSEGGGFSQSESIIDGAGNIHIFFVVKSSLGERLMHLYYIEEEVYLEVVRQNAQSLIIWYSYNTSASVGLVFSTISSSGENVFYHYHWDILEDGVELILSIPIEYIIGFDIFIKVCFVGWVVHVFYTFMWGEESTTTNLTHYYGYYEDGFTYETFILPYYDPLFQYARDVVDIVVDESQDIWYLYQIEDPTYGIGIYKIEAGSFVFYDFTQFSEVFYTVDKIITLLDDDPGEIFTLIFATPSSIHWGTFDGSVLTQHVQSTFYANPIEIAFEIQEGRKSVIITDYSETTSTVNFYHGSLEGSIFTFSTIVSSESIPRNHFSVSISGSNYLILFNKTVDTSDYKPEAGGSLRYREKQAIGLFILSSVVFQISTYIENLNVYNPIQEFFQTKWYILVIIGGVLALVVTILAILYSRKRKDIKAFLTDKQVGDFNRFTLFFLNIWRLISNIFSLIFSIWFSNKKRSVITLAGFLITGYLLSSAIIIAQSEESAMVKAFDRTYPLVGDRTISIKLDTTLTSTPNATYDVDAKEEIMELYDDYEFEKYIAGIESSYYTGVKVGTSVSPRLLVALPDESEEFLFSTLLEGRTPVNANEVIVKLRTAEFFHLEVNDTFLITPYKYNITVVGIYSELNVAQTRRLSNYLDLPHDIYNLFEIADILTKNSLFFELLSTMSSINQDLHGYYQFVTNFNQFKMAERTTLIEEQTTLNEKVFSFSFDSSSTLKIRNEMLNFFSNFNAYYLKNMARLLIFAVPAILLSIFMVFESSELFSSSYEKEIEILGNRGVRNRKLTLVYLTIRMFEVVAAALLSFGLAVLTANPLIKINGFLRFNNPDTHLVVGNVGVELVLVMFILFVISVPRIIMIVSRKRQVEKAPNVFKKILKIITWRDLFFLGIGSGFFFFFYNETFVAYYESNTGNFTTFLFLTIGGAIFILLGGLPLVIKLLSTFWKIIGFIIWKTRKTKISLTFSEISKDIRYFENITLIFLLVVCILIPVLVVPYSKESTLTEQAYFMNGADLKVENWHQRFGMTIEEVAALEGVESVTQVKLHNMHVVTIEEVAPLSFKTFPVSILEINSTNFLPTFYEPPSQLLVENWAQVGELSNNTVMMSTATLDHYILDVGDKYEFENVLMTKNHIVTVTADFDLFPVFYFEEDAEEESLMIVVNNECFDGLLKVDSSITKITDEIYVRLNDVSALAAVGDAIYSEAGLISKSFEDFKDLLKTPLYNIFIIEMILSLFVASIVLVFSSFTTAIKILEKRIVKHDIMKKMGLSVSRIVNMSTVQTMLAAVLPALGLGAAVGYLTIGPTLIQLNFGIEPFGLYINYPMTPLIILFVGIPTLVYIGLNYFLRREFTKYAPTVME
ncbi:MAG: hypothetical protein H7645_10150 [Candidatus Heimdallarchaeota archaeon]|nr:hypothetical protein [Candidatus Heimdallarchaeota archaeon]MCK4770689.1 hypothetical protein [Candidatus Heimdallarchaeota archaeon]